MNYAKIGYETGGLGLAAFGALLFTLLKFGWSAGQAEDADTRRLRCGLLAGIVAVCVAAVGGEVWEMPQIAFYFWMLGGLLSVLAVASKASLPDPVDQT